MSEGPSRLRVAVLFGGRSAEHEISVLSARNVVAALDRERFEPVLVGIDHEGRWRLQDEAGLLASARDPRLVRLEAGAEVSLPAHPREPGAATLELVGAPAVGAARGVPIDVVFPVLHGSQGEDGAVQGLLELTGLPYVGSGVLGSAVGMDKDVMRRLLDQAELPLCPWITVRRPAFERDASDVAERAIALADGRALFVKPANLGSSVGITRVAAEALAPRPDLGAAKAQKARAESRARVAAALDEAFAYDDKVVLERAAAAPGGRVREIECAVLGALGGEEASVSLPGEIIVDHADGFYSYAAKYIDESGATTVVPAKLTPQETSAVQLLALRTFKVLEGHGLARVDFFLNDEGELTVNEINTMPGFTAISMYPKLWEASGVARAELVSRLVDLALERAASKRRLKTRA